MRIRLWRTHDGRRIRLDHMADDHLKNAIAMIHRGHDAKGRIVTDRSRRMLPALLVEQEIRNIRRDDRNYNNPIWG
jgi:hypothetical protein